VFPVSIRKRPLGRCSLRFETGFYGAFGGAHGGVPFLLPLRQRNKDTPLSTVDRGFFVFTGKQAEDRKMIQEKNSNIEPDWPEITPEFVRELLVFAMVAWCCVRQGPGADLQKEMKTCMKDAHVRIEKMLAALQVPRKP